MGRMLSGGANGDAGVGGGGLHSTPCETSATSSLPTLSLSLSFALPSPACYRRRTASHWRSDRAERLDGGRTATNVCAGAELVKSDLIKIVWRQNHAAYRRRASSASESRLRQSRQPTLSAAWAQRRLSPKKSARNTQKALIITSCQREVWRANHAPGPPNCSLGANGELGGASVANMTLDCCCLNRSCTSRRGASVLRAKLGRKARTFYLFGLLRRLLGRTRLLRRLAFLRNALFDTLLGLVQLALELGPGARSLHPLLFRLRRASESLKKQNKIVWRQKTQRTLAAHLVVRNELGKVGVCANALQIGIAALFRQCFH